MENLTLTLPQSRHEMHDAALAVLEHIAVNPPEVPTIEYNLGLEILFTIVKTAITHDND